MSSADKQPRRLIVLGSTGSIGANTLQVVEHLNATAAENIAVVGLAAGRKVEAVIEQARKFNVPAVAIADADAADALRSALPGVTVFAGEDAAERLVKATDATDLTAAVVGSAGLPATIVGIRKGMRVGLANKETLVAAGALVTPLVRQHGARLIPVDSEHSAIFQCLDGQAGNSGGQANRAVKRIVLTASGGPFRRASKDEIRNATVGQALKHPTWNMGPKITIDSATMMNKALEIVEAHWLFGLPGDSIDVIVHPQSCVHSFVEFADNSVLAQLGPPDMKTPIQYALTYPDRPDGCSDAMDWTKLRQLDFESPDHDRFPSLRLAYDVIDAGGTAGAIFNAANEAAVAGFLAERIRFGQIVELVAEALSAVATEPATSLDVIYEADRKARQFVTDTIQKRAGRQALSR
jgi:1-deoxy-D-xylulose-5-phosphate reductoisomerase